MQSPPIPMAAGGGANRWQDGLEPNLRSLVRERMMTKLVEMLKADRSVTLAELHSFVARVEEGAFSTGQSKGDYLRRISTTMQSVHLNHKLPASAENRQQPMQIAQQMQLGNNPVQAIKKGGSSFLAMTEAASVLTVPVRSSFQQPPHMAGGPNMQIRPQNMMAAVNRKCYPQTATFAPMVPGIQSGHQVVHSIPMQSRNKRPAMQLQRPIVASYNQASVALLQAEPVVPPNAQPNHVLNQNASGFYGVQQQPAQVMRNQYCLGVNRHHGNSQLHQMVGANNAANPNIGYSGGLNNQQNVGCTAGLRSSLTVREQEVLKKQTKMESQLISPVCGQATVNQEGHVYYPRLQTPETKRPDQAVDFREKMFQQIQSLKAAYFSELMELKQIFVIPKITEEQLQSLPKQKSELYKSNSRVKDMITGVLNFLHLQKSEIPETYKEKLPKYETAIHMLLDYHRKIKAARIKGSNIRKESRDHHGKPQTIDLTGDTDPFEGGKSSCSQQNQSKQPANVSISRMRQNAVTKTPAAHQQADSSDPGRVKNPYFSDKSPGGLQSSLKNDAGACCTTSPVAKSGAVEVVSSYGSLNSALQSPIAKLGVLVADLPCASMKEFSLISDVDKSTILSPASSCSSVEPTLLLTVANPTVVPVASPCNLVKSTALDDINNCHQVTPSELTVPPSLGPPQTAGQTEVVPTVEKPVVVPIDSPCNLVSTAQDDINNRHRVTTSELTVPASPSPPQTEASQTKDVVCISNNTTVAKKPIDRLLDAVHASSPAVLRSSLNAIESALTAMDSVPLSPWSGYNNKKKRAYDITSSYSESPLPSSLDMSGAAYDGEHAAKRQKAQVDANEVLLDEIEDINSKLIDTTVSILGENPADCNGGTLIQLLYTRVSLTPRLKSHPLVMPVTLLVPPDYPASSPTLICSGDEHLRENNSNSISEVDAAFRRALHVLPEPRSLKEIASAWDTCVRRAITAFAQQHYAGGAPFYGSSFGRWESCVGA